MPVIEGGVSTTVAGVGLESGAALHVTPRPLATSTFGHYRTSHRCAMVNSQVANSRLFELQNPHASNLLIILRVRVSWVQTAAHTAAIEDSIDMFRCTSFSAVDTTNTVTPVISKMRTSYGTPVAGTNINVRGVTVAGAAAGMTGGTLTKDTAPLWQLPTFLLATVPTAGPTVQVSYEYQPSEANGGAPLVLVQNEGFILENRVALGVAAGSGVYIDVEWAETPAY